MWEISVSSFFLGPSLDVVGKNLIPQSTLECMSASGLLSTFLFTFIELYLHSLMADNLDFRWVRFLWIGWLPTEIYYFRVFFPKEKNL